MTSPKTFDVLIEDLVAHGYARSAAADFLIGVCTFWSYDSRRDRLECFERANTRDAVPRFDREAVVTDDNGHAGHVTHECRAAVRCSCGAIIGDIAIPAEGPIPPCEICCTRGLE